MTYMYIYIYIQVNMRCMQYTASCRRSRNMELEDRKGGGSQGGACNFYLIVI